MSEKTNKDLRILIEGAQRGEEEAFREIFERMSNRLFAYVLSHISNRDDALDIVQETFIELWSGLKKFSYKSDEAFYGFVFIIAKRKLYRYYERSRQKRAEVTLDEKAITASYEMDVKDYRYLFKHINTLASKYQELLRLRYWSGLSFCEIASVMNITETAAKVRHHRALQKLQTQLEKYENVI